MQNKLTINDLHLQGKRVFCRVDFNVPLDATGTISDDTRIVAALPTIKHIIAAGGRLILASHLGRPKGIPDAEFSLAPVAPYLSNLLGQTVRMAPDCVGDEVKQMVAAMHDGDVLLLENVRFHPGETKNDPAFSRQLADLADLYINDAFGTAHRAHASTEGVPRLLKQAACGFLMQEELRYLVGALAHPERPFVAILGGAKVSDKILVIENLLDKVDTLIIGGGMAYTFIKAQGFEVGRSLVEADRIELAGQLLKRAESQGVTIMLPVDHLAATSFAADAPFIVCNSEQIPAERLCLDIGPESIKLFSDTIATAKTVVWNGPMGVFEFPSFAKGTFSVAEALANSAALSIVGGGDSVAAVNRSGLAGEMTHISTGGGASLELLEGKILPGVAALTDC